MAWYLQAQLLLVLAWLLARALVRAPLERRAALWLGRLVAAVALLAPLAAGWLPSLDRWRPAPQVWSAPAPGGGLSLHPIAAGAAPALEASAATLEAGQTLGALGLGLAAAWAAACAGVLLWQLRRTVVWRRLGRVELRVSAAAPAPFAAWAPSLRGGRVIVVLDRATFSRPADRAVAIRHELQHHRQGDTLLAWPLLALRAACAWNPAAHLLARELAALEELACDAAVLAAGRVSPRDYGACLLRAAAATRRQPLAAGLNEPTLLKRRIEMLTCPPLTRAAWPVALLAAVSLSGAAWAAGGLVLEVGVDPEAVYEVADQVRAGGFELPSHPVVVDALEELTATSGGREFLHEGLRRRAEHSELVDGALERYGLPAELAAVPLVESGYRNLGEGGEGLSYAPGIPGKGLWMFIPQTAREYGLQVDAPGEGDVDQRLDLALETDAAMRLLSDLHAEFGDWGLALAGYNQGAAHVRRAIAEEGTRDPWALTERGALNGYAASVMAAALVIEAPSLAGPDLSRRLDLDLADADVTSVLRLLADAGGIDVIYTGEELPVAVSLEGVRLDEALDRVLESAGLTGKLTDDGRTLVVYGESE